MTTNVLRLAGCVLLDSHKRILLLHRNKNGLVQWELPGGKIDEGESEELTAVREIKEELGVDVVLVRKLGSAEFEGLDMPCYYTWFLAELHGEGVPTIGEPQTFDDMQYFPISECETLALSANMKNLMAAFHSGEVSLD